MMFLQRLIPDFTKLIQAYIDRPDRGRDSKLSSDKKASAREFKFNLTHYASAPRETFMPQPSVVTNKTTSTERVDREKAVEETVEYTPTDKDVMSVLLKEIEQEKRNSKIIRRDNPIGDYDRILEMIEKIVKTAEKWSIFAGLFERSDEEFDNEPRVIALWHFAYYLCVVELERLANESFSWWSKCELGIGSGATHSTSMTSEFEKLVLRVIQDIKNFKGDDPATTIKTVEMLLKAARFEENEIRGTWPSGRLTDELSKALQEIQRLPQHDKLHSEMSEKITRDIQAAQAIGCRHLAEMFGGTHTYSLYSLRRESAKPAVSTSGDSKCTDSSDVPKAQKKGMFAWL